MMFDKVHATYDEKGKRKLGSTGEPAIFIQADDVLIAISV